MPTTRQQSRVPGPTGKHRFRDTGEYADDFKGSILAEYAAGESTFALSKKHDVPMATIVKWINQYGIERGATVSEFAREEIGGALFQLMHTNIQGMIAISEQIINYTEWREKQTAGDLALLFATLNDKTVHLMSSIQTQKRREELDDTYERERTLSDGGEVEDA